ncbi:MAG: HEAT repeat domain-containing protein [Candidatus Odinarchaeota archaeon]
MLKNEISNSFAFDQLISFVENSENEQIREEAIVTLDRIGIFDNKLFKFLENILISDADDKIRRAVLKFLEKRYLNKAIAPLKWALNHENNYENLVIIIKSLKKANSEESKRILFDKTKEIIHTKYINKDKMIENRKFKEILKKLLKTKKYELFSHEELSLILINFMTIVNLIELYPNVSYEINPENGLLFELDLSDYFEYEVKGIPFGWKNNIKSISEIKGLNYLKSLTKINLSNNLIEDIKELAKLKNITHLTLSKNNMSNIKNLEYLKKFEKLEYLDLRDNEIASKIKSDEFNPNIRVLLKDSYLN